MATSPQPLVIDISHHNDVQSFADLYAVGIRGVIHKASEGATMVDKTHAKRKSDAVAAGLLWASYHFADNSTVANQVSNFLRAAQPDEKTALALDWEDKGARTMTLPQAKEFLQLVFDRTGQRPMLYGGNTIKEALGGRPDPFLARHRLWLCEYGPTAKCPPGWDTYFLWQYTEHGRVAGMAADGNVDLNVFGGTDLAAEWVCQYGPVVVPIKPTVAVKTEPDKPIVATSPADRPETKNTPDPVPAKTGFTVNDLMPVSRKAFRLVWLKRAVHVTWISLTTDKIMEYMGIAKGYREQVESFVSDHSTVLVITGGLTLVAVLSTIGKLMASDASSGTYTPSGLQPETNK